MPLQARAVAALKSPRAAADAAAAAELAVVLRTPAAFFAALDDCHALRRFSALSTPAKNAAGRRHGQSRSESKSSAGNIDAFLKRSSLGQLPIYNNTKTAVHVDSSDSSTGVGNASPDLPTPIIDSANATGAAGSSTELEAAALAALLRCDTALARAQSAPITSAAAAAQPVGVAAAARAQRRQLRQRWRALWHANRRTAAHGRSPAHGHSDDESCDSASASESEAEDAVAAAGPGAALGSIGCSLAEEREYVRELAARAARHGQRMALCARARTEREAALAQGLTNKEIECRNASGALAALRAADDASQQPKVLAPDSSSISGSGMTKSQRSSMRACPLRSHPASFQAALIAAKKLLRPVLPRQTRPDCCSTLRARCPDPRCFPSAFEVALRRGYARLRPVSLFDCRYFNGPALRSELVSAAISQAARWGLADSEREARRGRSDTPTRGEVRYRLADGLKHPRPRDPRVAGAGNDRLAAGRFAKELRRVRAALRHVRTPGQAPLWLRGFATSLALSRQGEGDMRSNVCEFRRALERGKAALRHVSPEECSYHSSAAVAGSVVGSGVADRGSGGLSEAVKKLFIGVSKSKEAHLVRHAHVR